MSSVFELYHQHAALAILLFCLAHLVASSIGIPGGCTALNIGAGAVFGFPIACAVIYPITMFGACLLYAAGAFLKDRTWALATQERLSQFMVRLRKGDFLFLTVLRLSPVIPFGAMNFCCGLLRIPFGVFFLSTFAGIFFDVTVLASVGASLQIRGLIGGVFFALLMVLIVGRYWISKTSSVEWRRRRRGNT